MQNNISYRGMIIIWMVLLLSGCGQIGPLYLPSHTAQTQTTGE